MEKLQMLITADAGGAIREFKKVGNAADKDLGRATGSADRMSSKMMSMGAGAVVGAIALGAGLAGLAKDAADAETEELVKRAHPFGVAASEVVVDRDDVNAEPG